MRIGLSSFVFMTILPLFLPAHAGRGDRPVQMSMPFDKETIDFSDAADRKRDQAITEILKVLDKVKDDKKAELIFRLAETYWEKSKYAYSNEYQRFDTAFQKWVEGGRQGDEPNLSTYTAESSALKIKSINHYDAVLKQYPRYSRLDEVLYMLGYSQYESGKKQAAIENYSDLIRQFEDSIYVADAYLALGEYYFESNDADKAAKAYDKAYRHGLKSGRTATYMYALYKLAWCEFNHHRFADALDKFKQVVLLSDQAAQRQQNQGTQGKDAIQLRREALVDMVRTFAELGEVKQAYAYFLTQVDPKQAYDLMQKLAKAFQSHGMHQREIESYDLLVNIDGAAAEIPRYRASMMKAYAQLSDRKGIKSEAKKVIVLCATQSGDDACDIAEQTLRELALQYHRFADKLKQKEDFELARDLYEFHGQAFVKYEEAYRLQFFWAEILWDMGEWEKAADVYDQVIMKNPNGEFSKTAAANAILTWEKVIGEQERPHFIQGRLVVPKDVPKKGSEKIAPSDKQKLSAPAPIAANELRLIAACDQYVKLIGASPASPAENDELLRASFKAAYIYQTHFYFDEAELRFLEIIKKWPTSNNAVVAATLILDSLDARKDWPKLALRAHEFRQNSYLIADKQFALSATKFEEGARFNEILAENERVAQLPESTEKNQLLAVVADRFALFAEEFDRSNFAQRALYNATLIDSKISRIELAIALGEKLLSVYRNKNLDDDQSVMIRKNVMSIIANLHERVMNLESASKWYEEFAREFPTANEAADMLYNAAFIQFALGHYVEAAKLFSRYAITYPKQKDIVDAQFYAAMSLEKAKDTKGALGVYGDIATKMTKNKDKRVVEAEFRMAKLMKSSVRQSETMTLCRDILRNLAAFGRGANEQDVLSDAGAFCSFQILDKEWDLYQKISFKVPLSKIKKQIQLKRSRMEELGKKYIDVLTYKNAEWGVASLYRAAEVQLEYVRALREIPSPRGLNDEALDLFRTELENVVFPVEEEAIVALEKALEKALELGVYSPVVEQIQQRLASFDATRKPQHVRMPFFLEGRALTDLQVDIPSEELNREIGNVKSALLARPEELSSLKRLATLYFAQNKNELCEWLIERVVKMYGEDAELLNMKGLIRLRENSFSLAAPFFKRALEVDSKRLDALMNLGALSLMFDDKANAFDAYSKARKIDGAPQTAERGQEASRGEG